MPSARPSAPTPSENYTSISPIFFPTDSTPHHKATNLTAQVVQTTPAQQIVAPPQPRMHVPFAPPSVIKPFCGLRGYPFDRSPREDEATLADFLASFTSYYEAVGSPKADWPRLLLGHIKGEPLSLISTAFYRDVANNTSPSFENYVALLKERFIHPHSETALRNRIRSLRQDQLSFTAFADEFQRLTSFLTPNNPLSAALLLDLFIDALNVQHRPLAVEVRRQYDTAEKTLTIPLLIRSILISKAADTTPTQAKVFFTCEESQPSLVDHNIAPSLVALATGYHSQPQPPVAPLNRNNGSRPPPRSQHTLSSRSPHHHPAQDSRPTHGPHGSCFNCQASDHFLRNCPQPLSAAALDRKRAFYAQKRGQFNPSEPTPIVVPPPCRSPIIPGPPNFSSASKSCERTITYPSFSQLIVCPFV